MIIWTWPLVHLCLTAPSHPLLPSMVCTGVPTPVGMFSYPPQGHSPDIPTQHRHALSSILIYLTSALEDFVYTCILMINLAFIQYSYFYLKWESQTQIPSEPRQEVGEGMERCGGTQTLSGSGWRKWRKLNQKQKLWEITGGPKYLYLKM